MKKSSLKSFLTSNVAALLCLALFVFDSIFANNFFSVQSIMSLLSQTVPYMFCTMAMTLVISTGCTDLSVGAVMAVSSSVTGTYIWQGGNTAIGLGLGIAICIVAGIINGILVAKFNLQPLVAMMVTRMIYRAAVQIYTSGITRTVKSDFGTFIGSGKIGGVIPIIIIPMILVIALTWFIAKKTKFGKEIEAVGNNKRTAHLCGINVVKTIMCVYILSAVFACIGGQLDMFRTGALDASTIGLDYEMTAIAATTIGGTSMRGGKAKVMGSAFGCILMTLITATINFFNVPYQLSNIVKAIVIILSLALQNKKRA